MKVSKINNISYFFGLSILNLKLKKFLSISFPVSLIYDELINHSFIHEVQKIDFLFSILFVHSLIFDFKVFLKNPQYLDDLKSL